MTRIDLPSGTNKTGRTAMLVVASNTASALEKLQADYVCDGTADNVEIQAAIDALPSTGGKVSLSEGTFNLAATINIAEANAEKGITLEGQGYGTILKINNSTNIYALTFVPSTNGIWATFRDFYIQCNGANQTTGGGGIYAAGAIECLFDNIYFNEPFNYGIYFYQISAGVVGHHNRVTNCLFDQGDNVTGEGVGILLQSNDENRITNCEFQYMGGSAGTIAPAAIIDRTGLNTIANCVFVSGGEGIRMVDASRMVIANNIFDSVVRNNIYLKGTEILVFGNQFYEPNEGAADNTYNVLRVDYYGDNAICNNFFRSNETASKTRSFVQDDGLGRNVYLGNKFEIQGAMGTSIVDITSLDNTVEGNVGLSIPSETKSVWMKNTSGGDLAAGDVVILKSVANGDEVTTTTTGGDDKVFGMATRAITSNTYGFIQVRGKTTLLKVDGTTDIAIGDYLSTFTTAKIAKKATAGDQVFAMALEAYTTNDSNGVIDALLI